MEIILMMKNHRGEGVEMVIHGCNKEEEELDVYFEFGEICMSRERMMNFLENEVMWSVCGYMAGLGY